jgi:polyisoprenoid-binding protein YceI
LVTHLTGEAAGKEGDFFNTKKYPTATFAITGVEAVSGVEGVTHKISGNLTMLEKTGNVTFDANVVIADGNLTATTTDFTFDRTVWGIKFMSTLAGMVKEQAIKNEITISVKLQAAMAQ